MMRKTNIIRTILESNGKYDKYYIIKNHNGKYHNIKTVEIIIRKISLFIITHMKNINLTNNTKIC